MVILERRQLLDQIESSSRQLSSELDSIAELGYWNQIATGEWTVRETLSVRTRWTEMLIGWISEGLEGRSPETPAPGYKWNETPRLNEEIVRSEAGSDPATLRHRLDVALGEIRELIERLDEDQLMLPAQFGWTRSWCVSRWISMNTVTQYRSLGKMIRRVLRDHSPETA